MTRINTEHASTSIEAQAEEVIVALRTLKPNVIHRRNQMFSLLYPVIVDLKEQGITQKSILEMLKEKGLKLHPARFKEMMATEAQKIHVTPGSRSDEEDAE